MFELPPIVTTSSIDGYEITTACDSRQFSESKILVKRKIRIERTLTAANERNQPFNLSRPLRAIRFEFTVLRFHVGRSHPNEAVVSVKRQILLIVRYRQGNDTFDFLLECRILNGADAVTLSQFEELVFARNETACVALFRDYRPASRVQNRFC